MDLAQFLITDTAEDACIDGEAWKHPRSGKHPIRVDHNTHVCKERRRESAFGLARCTSTTLTFFAPLSLVGSPLEIPTRKRTPGPPLLERDDLEHTLMSLDK